MGDRVASPLARSLRADERHAGDVDAGPAVAVQESPGHLGPVPDTRLLEDPVVVLCREPLSAFNARRGSLARDAGVGAAMGVACLVCTLAVQPLLTRLVAPHRNPDAMTLITGLLENPLLLLVWFGPVLWIGVASFEEVARVFCINRIVAIRPGAAGRSAAIVISTAVFGLMHYYQGPSAIITTAGMGLVLAFFYVRNGRIWPLIVAHGVYDALSIGFALLMISRAGR